MVDFNEYKHDRQRTYNVTARGIRANLLQRKSK